MAADLAVAAGPLATAKEQESLLASAQVNGQVEKLVAYGYLECRRSDYNVVQYRLTDMAYDAGCGERPTVD